MHGTTPEAVHFHEVGALDAIADVVAACAGFAHLGLTALHVSAVALGGGTVQAAHGRMSVPGPAVVRLLADAPSYGGPVDVELATPTGAALLATHATAWGPAPAMTGTRQGHGAGGRDLAGHANVLRLVVGEPWSGSGHAEAPGTALVLETNVDDQDPRLWPAALAALLDAGASDAWLTPILMKKGRPAHTLHVLVHPSRAAQVRDAVFEHTSAIGLREQVVTKHALDRRRRHRRGRRAPGAGEGRRPRRTHAQRPAGVGGRRGRRARPRRAGEDGSRTGGQRLPRHGARLAGPARRPRRLSTGRPQPLTTLGTCRPPSCASSSRC